METAYDYCNYEDNLVWFSSDERKTISKILRLAAEWPADVLISKRPEENGGYIVGQFPRAWLKIYPPRKISDERRAAMAEQMKLARRAKRGTGKGSMIDP